MPWHPGTSFHPRNHDSVGTRGTAVWSRRGWNVSLPPRGAAGDEANRQRPVAGPRRTNLTIALAFVKNSAVFRRFRGRPSDGRSRTDRPAHRLLFGLRQVLLLSRKASHDPNDCKKPADSPPAADVHRRLRAGGCLAGLRLPGKCRRLEPTGPQFVAAHRRRLAPRLLGNTARGAAACPVSSGGDCGAVGDGHGDGANRGGGFARSKPAR